MPIPTCSLGCDSVVPVVSFDECSPEINSGQLQVMYVGNRNNPFVSWTDLTEWSSRLSNTSTDSSAIRTMFIIGGWPLPERAEKIISLNRTIYQEGKHTINFKIDETNAINHEMLRSFECGGQYSVWVATGQIGDDGKLIWGGNEGIEASLQIGQVVPESTDENITYEGTLKFTSKFTPERTGTDLIS